MAKIKWNNFFYYSQDHLWDIFSCRISDEKKIVIKNKSDITTTLGCCRCFFFHNQYHWLNNFYVDCFFLSYCQHKNAIIQKSRTVNYIDNDGRNDEWAKFKHHGLRPCVFVHHFYHLCIGLAIRDCKVFGATDLHNRSQTEVRHYFNSLW